jgi:hypothetical protein
MKAAFELRALFWYGYPFAFNGKDVQCVCCKFALSVTMSVSLKTAKK